MRRGLFGFVLLGLTLMAFSAHACRIERTNANTVTIYGECGEKMLMAQLSVAIRQLEASGDLSRSSQSEQKDKVSGQKRLDLVNGYAKGSTATFFHRPSGKR